jgi:type III secretory pathway component EscS
MNKDKDAQVAFPEARAKKLSEKKALWLILLFGAMVLLIGSGIAGGLIGFADAKTGTSQAAGLFPWLTIFIIVVVFPVTFWWSLKYWRSIDEMAKRAHLDAFYWGGTIAWIAIMPLILLPHKAKGFVLPPIEALNMNASQIFSLGMTAAILATGVGYFVAWLFWWAKRR